MDRPGSWDQGVLGAGRPGGPESEWPPRLNEVPDGGGVPGAGRPRPGQEWPPRLGENPDDQGVLGAGRPGHGSSRQIPTTAAIVFGTLLLALALCAAAVYQVFQEYHLLGAWVAHPERVSLAEVQAL